MQQRWWIGVLAIGFLVAMGSVPRGHTPIASRWNFNEHLYPVFKERCGSCHVDVDFDTGENHESQSSASPFAGCMRGASSLFLASI